jgi:hypothetical protein
MRRATQILTVLVILGAAIVGFWFGVSGILDGAVEFPSKGHQLVLRAASPRLFWGCVAAWFAIAVGFIALAVVNFKALMRS